MVRSFTLLFLSIFISGDLAGHITLPSVFSDGMVLQQRSDAAIWGRSDINERLTITTSWNNMSYHTVPSQDGFWKIKVQTPAAGGSYSIRISNAREAIQLNDILIGEVWVASGQSNMEMPMKGFKNAPVLNAEQAIKESDNAQIRLFHEKKISWGTPLPDCQGKWEQAGPGSVTTFSAVGYWFAKILQEKLKVPVGIIETAWGGTVIEAWMNAESLSGFPEVTVPKQEDKEFDQKNTPTGLFNGMVNPITGYGIKGVIWYQGEQNRNKPLLYARLFPAMVKAWRDAWGIGDFAFYYAQIAPYLSGAEKLSKATLELKPKIPYLREAQLNAGQKIPRSGMAVLLDIGSKKTIHPPDKKTVAKRLSYLALAKTYGWKNVTWSGPVYKSMKMEGDHIILKFDHAGKGLVLTDDGSANFEIAGDDHIFYPARAKITKEGLSVSSLYVKRPAAVRYAFKAWVVGTLFNKAGLPASSFRTDNWEVPWKNDEEDKPAFQMVKYNNPGTVVDLGVGLWGWPVPMDFDGDGDMDLLVSSQGKPYNGLYLFENISGDKMPVFAKPVRLSKSIKDIQVSYIHGKPRVTVPGAELLHFKTSFNKEKKALFPVDSILKNFGKKPRFDQWKLVDYDGDGDVDIVAGVDDWSDYGWDNAYSNAGKWTNGPLHGYVYLIENKNGKYINKGRIQANGKDLDVYGAPSPNFADYDGDGDLDIICGEFLDKLTWFENTGTREKPVYTKGRYLVNASGIIKMDLEMIVPVAVDWNRDGHTDLVVGQEDGRVALIENTGKVKNGMPVFKSPVFFKQQADDLKFGVLATPYSVDWDSDGDEDLICGNSAGYISFIENLGMHDNMPRWAPPVLLKSNGKIIRIQAGKNGSIQGPAEAKWGYTTLSVADWDGDGLKDILVNSIWGKVIWYKNTGGKGKPVLSGPMPVKVDWPGKPPKPAWNWWNPGKNELAIAWRTTPYATDWNKDGLMDLILVDHEGYLSFFERTKKNGRLILEPGKRIFYGMPYSGFDMNNRVTDSMPGLLCLNTGEAGRSGRRKFCLADWNGDGQIDFLVNSENISLMENGGIRGGMVLITDKGKLAAERLAGHTTSPAIVDWNKDGVPDLLVGAEDGHFYYLMNPMKQK